MQQQNLPLADYFMGPGHIFLSRKPTLIKTILGSCVAVFIWDRELKFGGCNHFIYPAIGDKNQATARYGNVAMIVLFKMMREQISLAEDWEAHVVGGAYPEQEESARNVGLGNVKVAKRFLTKRQIRIRSEDVGGTMGRKVAFDSSTGKILVLKVPKLRESDWYL